MKTCFKCQKNKPVSEFYRHPKMGDGRLGKCKACTKADVTKHRNENIKKIRAYDNRRAKLPHRKELRNRVNEKYFKNNPRRRRAMHAVNNAVRAGRLVRQPCQVCGSEKWIHAHHENYDKPLDVMWLCPAHHKERHKEIGNQI
jgi:hypothetical protein